MRERNILLIALIVLSLLVAGVLVGVFIEPLPEIVTGEGRLVSQALKVFFGVAAAVFLGVEGLLVFAALRGHFLGDSQGRVTGGLEVLWIAVPGLLVAVIVVYSINVLAQIEAPASNPLVVNITARQFEWEIEYPGLGVRSTELHLPTGRAAKLVFTSEDVIHSFWVPEFGGKIDAVPGIATSLTVTPMRAGILSAVCAELCGAGHTNMVAEVWVQDPEVFEEWLAAQ